MPVVSETPRIFSIEGNVGSGKSTFVDHLKNWYSRFGGITKIVFLKEPVNTWTSIADKNGENIIEKFYKDQKKYAFSFQMMAYISRLACLKEAVEKNPNAIIVTERSLYTDREVFAKMLYDDGMIEEVDYKIYLKWFDHFCKDYPLEGIIYLNTDYSICCERVEKRDRKGEDEISKEYLANCATYHNKWIYESCFEKNILEINANKEMSESTFKEWSIEFHKFITRPTNITAHSKYHYSNCI